MAPRPGERTDPLEHRRRTAGKARDAVKIVWIPLSTLRKGEINRELDYTLIWDIALTFEWGALALTVTDNGDGTYKVREGHHRFEALQLVFAVETDTLVPCVVTRARGSVTGGDHRGQHQHHPEVVDGAWQVQPEGAPGGQGGRGRPRRPGGAGPAAGREGGAGGRGGGRDGHRGGVRLRQAQDGVGAVRRAFVVLQGAYGRDPDAYRVGMVRGTWEFLLRYALTHPPYREDVLVKALHGTKVLAVYDSTAGKFAAAKAKAVVGGHPNALDERTAFAWAIYEAYNSYISPKHSIDRLPEFGLASTDLGGASSAHPPHIKEYQAWESGPAWRRTIPPTWRPAARPRAVRGREADRTWMGRSSIWVPRDPGRASLWAVWRFRDVLPRPLGGTGDYVDKLIRGLEVVEVLHTNCMDVASPANEGQARALLPLLDRPMETASCVEGFPCGGQGAPQEGDGTAHRRGREETSPGCSRSVDASPPTRRQRRSASRRRG